MKLSNQKVAKLDWTLFYSFPTYEYIYDTKVICTLGLLILAPLPYVILRIVGNENYYTVIKFQIQKIPVYIVETLVPNMDIINMNVPAKKRK